MLKRTILISSIILAVSTPSLFAEPQSDSAARSYKTHTTTTHTTKKKSNVIDFVEKAKEKGKEILNDNKKPHRHYRRHKTEESANTLAPKDGATAICNDGTYSYSHHHEGACSHHHGVKKWI